ncbi:MAG TPA: aldehyde dehydrogenase family protein [Baekduia sp.]|nr:aldehyde dehydrogenase family protein [Baekduia sp.]HMJ33752.1 aldehyde dehydrogenase family protein [Baekduia sp.]
MRVAAEVVPGQRHLKRTVVEMGGKNCVIVDTDADLDGAVHAIVHSAFADAGQKCSSASRVLVHEAVADAVVARLAHAVDRLRVGPADAFDTSVGNLYVNRAITGAMVGRQPFGGNRLSGTGSKAGGPDYLLQFVDPLVVTESTVRHGAPR